MKGGADHPCSISSVLLIAIPEEVLCLKNVSSTLHCRVTLTNIAMLSCSSALYYLHLQILLLFQLHLQIHLHINFDPH